MDLRDIFGSDVARYERERKQEQEFQNQLDDSTKRFRRQGWPLLIDGDIAGLRQLYIDRAIEPAMNVDGRETDVLGRMEEELHRLMAELEAEDEDDPFADL